MKAIQFNSANVIKSAIKCMNFEMDAATSISKGMMIETLKRRMMRGEVVRFCYQKLDGTIRYAVGTLQSDAVKANVAGTGIPKRFYGMLGDNDKKSPVSSGAITKNGYILSHYAKYAKKTDRIKLEFTANQSGVQGTAYMDESGKTVTFVLLNYSSDPTTVVLNGQNSNSNISEYSGVITDKDKNMENLSIAVGDDNSGVIVPMSAQSIVSVRLKYN